jgi:hypothetical protein
LLGRIAGIDEKTLTAMLDRQEFEAIIEDLEKTANNARNDCPHCAALK